MNSIDFRNRIYAGQQTFADAMREILAIKDEQQLDRLNFENDDCFLDPLLFAYFNSRQPRMTLDQILFGYYDADKRPKKFKAHANENGIVHIPRVGYYKTAKKSSLINVNTGDRGWTFDDDREAAFFPLVRLKNHLDMELVRFSDPLTEEVLLSWPGLTHMEINQSLSNFNSEIERFIDPLNKAFEILQKYCPKDYQDFLACTKRIVLCNSTKIRSFVTRNFHGVIFLNMIDSSSDETFFIEELVHQCSHNVFNSVTANTEQIFKIDSETLLSDLIDDDKEKRSLFSAYHGHYTVSKGLECLALCLDVDNGLSTEKNHELHGRLAIKQNRFRSGLEKLSHDSVFTETGKMIYSYLETLGELTLQNHKPFFNKLKFDNQGAVFSRAKFWEANPLPLKLNS